MLFVANIGSTMAKMFAFVFSRITMIFCCRWNAKKRRTKMKPRQKKAQTAIVLDGKLPPEKAKVAASKSSLKQPTNDEKDLVAKSRGEQTERENLH